MARQSCQGVWGYNNLKKKYTQSRAQKVFYNRVPYILLLGVIRCWDWFYLLGIFLKGRFKATLSNDSTLRLEIVLSATNTLWKNIPIEPAFIYLFI